MQQSFSKDFKLHYLYLRRLKKRFFGLAHLAIFQANYNNNFLKLYSVD